MRRVIVNAWICGLLSGLALSAATPEMQRYEHTERHMGMDCTVILYAAQPEQAQAAFTEVFQGFANVDRTASDYSPDSELLRLSQRSPTCEPVPVSKMLWELLCESQSYSDASDGAFDITVGPLTKLWRRAKRQKELPEAEDLKLALTAVGWKNLRLHPENQTVELLVPHMRLDVGGIAQGYAADRALQQLKQRGIAQALVDISGDVRCSEPPPNSTGWRVGIAALKAQEEIDGFTLLANSGLATSGDAFQGVEIGGVRYSHIVDPRTGLGLKHRSSVTVIAPTAITADALSTAISVLDRERGLELLKKYPGVSGRIVWQTESGEVRELHSPNWKLKSKE